MVMIAPSLLSADFGNLKDEIARCEAAGADLFHVDVMDGHYVGNITIGPVVVKGVRKYANVPLDVHLMITNPERYAEAFCEAGADYLVAHVEAPGDTGGALRIAREMGVKTGIAINPETAAKSAMALASLVDLVLVMSVHPGFAGQRFIPDVLEKIAPLREAMRADAVIEIDGGLNPDTAERAREAGVDIIVAGSAIFKADNMAGMIETLRG